MSERVWAIVGLVVVALAPPVGAGDLTATWQNNCAMLVQRCAGSGCTDFADLVTIPAVQQTYVDTGLALGSTYCYQVVAVDALGDRSAPSDPACATVATMTFAAEQAFAYPGGTVSPYVVALGSGYSCQRTVGGTATLRIYRGSTLLRSVAQPNPAIGTPWTLRCESDVTGERLLLDGVLKLTAGP